jgi:alkanesulfonate monooxygenase SsuD/methylene tetrahydromethanopterin reductase-like flavin-dependent oxidoreductase (luciferase family)
MASTPQLNELGFYVLAGAPKSPAELLDEVPAAESLGLGSAFISERFNIKEAVTLSGAVAAASKTLGIATAKADTATLEHIAALLPDEWLEPAATGSPERCAERVLRQFDLGVDGVIMHGASPDQLAPVAEAYRTIRPAGRFDGLDPNPGR